MRAAVAGTGQGKGLPASQHGDAMATRDLSSILASSVAWLELLVAPAPPLILAAFSTMDVDGEENEATLVGTGWERWFENARRRKKRKSRVLTQGLELRLPLAYHQGPPRPVQINEFLAAQAGENKGVVSSPLPLVLRDRGGVVGGFGAGAWSGWLGEEDPLGAIG